MKFDKKSKAKIGILLILAMVLIIGIELAYAFTFADNTDTDFLKGNLTGDGNTSRVVGTGAGANVTINISRNENQTLNLFGRGIEVNASVVLYLLAINFCVDPLLSSPSISGRYWSNLLFPIPLLVWCALFFERMSRKKENRYALGACSTHNPPFSYFSVCARVSASFCVQSALVSENV